MKAERIVLRGRQRQRLLRRARRTGDPDLRVRYMIVAHTADGWGIARIAEALGCSTATVSRTRRRWRDAGEAGLADRRGDNGEAKVDERYVATVRWILRAPATAYLHRRPTWTLPLLVETARLYAGGVTVSVTTMGRVLARLKVRRGRAKPLAAPCPWGAARKNERLAMIAALVETLPADQACVWVDEVDVDLNPRIGFDWTLPGAQRTVPTPGKNVKRYVAGAMDATTDRLTWVRGDRKNSGLFIDLLKKLKAKYAERKAIHVILDNYGIHSSRQTQAWLAEHGRTFRLHFLPPYCPDDNRIERCVWREMHQNVTTNHRHETIDALMDAVTSWLVRRNLRLSGLRKAI
jgi:transposase